MNQEPHPIDTPAAATPPAEVCLPEAVDEPGPAQESKALTAPAQEPAVLLEPQPSVQSDAIAPIVVMRPGSHIWWAMAATLIAMTASGSFLAWHFLPSARVAQQDATRAATQVYADLRDAAAQMTQSAVPQAQINTVIETALGELTGRGKLVVLTRSLPVRVEKRSVRKILWDQFNLEDSIVRMRVNNNTVQYILPLGDLTPASFHYDPPAKTLSLTLPEPRLDREMIAMSSNPGDWEVEKDISWSRVQDWFGSELEAQARAELRPLVIAAGEEPLVLKEAREQGYLQVTALVKSIVAPFAPDLQVEVRFDPSLSSTNGADTWPNSAPLS